MLDSNCDEIRRVRTEMLAKAGHDIRRLIAMINEKRSDYAARIINPGGEAERSDLRQAADGELSQGASSSAAG